ncbi:MAG: hypothetical protein H0X29_01110 [Parachlamydiaceae bacterium]|nr:hypothetical protein [Parachlamydiaceae bacterium]
MPRKPHHTKDESFVISLYEEAAATGNLETPIDRYQAGKRAGISPKGVDTICRLIIQANFVRKVGESEIHFTPHGISLAEKLIAE